VATAASRIEAHGDLAGKGARGLAHQVGVLDRDGAEDHAGDPLLQPHLDRGHVADAAAELGGNIGGREDALHRRAVHRLAREGAVEIDQVQPLAARVLERARLGGGIGVEHGGLVHLAAQEAHGLAVLEVDGGVEDHGRTFAGQGFLASVRRGKGGAARPAGMRGFATSVLQRRGVRLRLPVGQREDPT
jgi:hypothetical protein